MTLLRINMIAMTISCLLLIGGYSANKHPLGGVAMFVGVIGVLLVIAGNIYAQIYGWV
ncbi:MAG: hypothetical protein Q4G71_04275 [Pseudomonadota bacterium]|nr:hypothetical protein [Pseudomonadota bacterium]